MKPKPMVAVALFALAVLAAAQDQRPTGGVPGKQIGTPTRQVAMFQQLERQLLEAQQDKTKLDALLADDFEQRDAGQPGEVVDRDTALERASAHAAVQGGFRDLNVRMEGDAAIVNFVLVSRLQGKAAGKHDQAAYVVDVWRKRGDGYELAARYTAPLSRPAAKGTHPTGKE